MLYKLKSKTSIEFWVILLLFIMGLLVRLYHLGGPCLHFDEMWGAMWINHPLSGTVNILRQWEFPPLYYVFMNLWARAFGNGEWALRFPSVVFSGLTIIVIFKLGKELFNEGVGFISALLLIFSPFAIFYAQFVKMYALFWFLAAGSFLFFFRFLKDQGENSYKFYIIASILSCYTMYTGFLLLAAQNMIFLLMGQRARWREWFTGQLIIICLCIPWIILFLCSQHEHWWSLRPPGTTYNYFVPFLKSLLVIIGSYPNGPVGNSCGILGKVNCFLYVFLITFLLIDVLAVSYKNKKTGLPLPMHYYCLFLWIITSIFIYFIFDYFFVPTDLSPRYIGFLQVPLILLVSSQINKWRGLIRTMLVLAMVVIAMNNAYLRNPLQDWRGTAEQLTRAVGKNDIVLSFVDVPVFKYYYKADTSRFFMITGQDCSSEALAKKDILTRDVHSIFILYHGPRAPGIALNGFSLDYKINNGGIGFLHFQRTRSKSNSGK